MLVFYTNPFADKALALLLLDREQPLSACMWAMKPKSETADKPSALEGGVHQHSLYAVCWLNLLHMLQESVCPSPERQ